MVIAESFTPIARLSHGEAAIARGNRFQQGENFGELTCAFNCVPCDCLGVEALLGEEKVASTRGKGWRGEPLFRRSQTASFPGPGLGTASRTRNQSKKPDISQITIDNSNSHHKIFDIPIRESERIELIPRRAAAVLIHEFPTRDRTGSHFLRRGDTVAIAGCHETFPQKRKVAEPPSRASADRIDARPCRSVLRDPGTGCLACIRRSRKRSGETRCSTVHGCAEPRHRVDLEFDQ